MKREIYLLKERLGSYERAKRELADREREVREASRAALMAIEPNASITMLPSVAQANGILARGMAA